MKSLHVNPPSDSRAETCGQTDWHDKRNGRFRQIRGRAEQTSCVGTSWSVPMISVTACGLYWPP